MKPAIMTALVASAFLFTIDAGAQKAAQPGAIPALVTTTCQNCHGLTGNSSLGTIPRLNGQQSAYLFARLTSLRDPGRQTPRAINAMWDHSHIADDVKQQIADYFAAQAPTAPGGGGRLAEAGKKIYDKGVGTDVPACQSCHGAHGEGNGTVPRLAGQHAAYLAEQLEEFNLTLRDNTTMNMNTHLMTEDQIKEVVAYLAKD